VRPPIDADTGTDQYPGTSPARWVVCPELRLQSGCALLLLKSAAIGLHDDRDMYRRGRGMPLISLV